MTRDELDAALIQAHRDEDREALIALYTRAGDLSEADGDEDAASFYLTHAFVFALEAGAPEAKVLNGRLAAKGRSELLEF